MRVHWISAATYERVCEAIGAAMTPRDEFCATAHWRALVKMDPDPDGIIGIEDHLIHLDGFMVFLAMLVAPKPWIEPYFPRAFGLPTDEVNAIGRIVLGEGWAGIGALTMCEDGADGGLTLTCDARAGALEVVG